MGLGLGLELTPCEGCESLALPPPGSVTLPSLRRPPYGRVSERVILRNDTESESESKTSKLLFLKAGVEAIFAHPGV